MWLHFSPTVPSPSERGERGFLPFLSIKKQHKRSELEFSDRATTNFSFFYQSCNRITIVSLKIAITIKKLYTFVPC